MIAKNRWWGVAGAALIAVTIGGAALQFSRTTLGQMPGADARAPGANPPEDRQRPEPRDRERRRPVPSLERAIDQLELSDAQRQQIEPIAGAYRQKEQQARAEMLRQMKEALTPAQYERFELAMTRPGPPPRERVAPAEAPTERPEERAGEHLAAPVAVIKPGETVAAVTFNGGHETDPRDGGRPVVLIAAALNVPSDVFRKAFSGVTPAAGGEEPQPEQVRRNKQALLKVLGPYGITNDQLDTVSNYYRYSGSRGQMWRNTPATATATVRDGAVVAITITNPGSGYSSAPTISVPGTREFNAAVTLAFGTDFKKNGSIAGITVGDAKGH
jgi:hypothetical protein